ncbi:MAG: flavin reductase family protein [Bacteroidota bacterium]
MSESIKTIDPKDLSTGELHGYLLGAVAPRPIAFASTIDAEGRVNLSPFSFFNVFGSNPPLMIFSSARRVRDNTTKHTLENVQAVPEVVINIVNYPIVEQMSLASTEYPQGVNEFIKSGLTQSPSDVVRPPRVAEAPVAFECKVQQVIETGNEGGAGNLILSEVVKIHIRSSYLNADGKLDLDKLDLVGRMGGSYYVRASGDALFEIPKPIRTRGIGVDALPDSVQDSRVLTGNQLGRLGNLAAWPDQQKARQRLEQNEDLVELLSAEQEKIHTRVSLLLNTDRLDEAADLLAATS